MGNKILGAFIIGYLHVLTNNKQLTQSNNYHLYIPLKFFMTNFRMSPGLALLVKFVGVFTTLTAMLLVEPSAEKFGRSWPSASSPAACLALGAAASVPFAVLIGQSSMAPRFRF